MDQIMNSFHGDYKSKQLAKQSFNEQQQQQQESVPKPRPSECPKKLTYHHLIFSRKNFLMQNDIVSEALIVESAETGRFSSIDVDYEVTNKKNIKLVNDHLYVGTDDGKVLKFVIQQNEKNRTESKMVFSEKIEIFKHIINENEIFNIKLYKRTHLILVTQNKVLSLPIESFCANQSKTACNNQFNPYCVWKESKCFYLYSQSPSLITNVNSNMTTSVKLMSTKMANYYRIKNEEKLYLKEKKLYQVKNNEIIISMNLVLFLAIMFTLFILSFVFLILFVFNIYQKIYKRTTKKPNAMKSSPFKFVSVGLNGGTGDTYHEHPSPCQTASPLSSSQSLNTTTKSSNVSSMYNPTFQNSSTHSMDIYKQMHFVTQDHEKKLTENNNYVPSCNTLFHSKNNLNIYTNSVNNNKNNNNNSNLNGYNKNDMESLNDKKEYESTYLRPSDGNFFNLNGFNKYYV
jgi:hypothetical protein